MTVYPPREDSYLLKSYLEEEVDLHGKTVLDMGTGSGIQAYTAAEQGAEVTAVDINPEAVTHVRAEALRRGEDIEVVCSDLFENVEGRYDLIIFNPPYLPGPEDVGDEEIWRGGEKGVELTERFLDEAENYLSSNGDILVIGSSEAGIEELIDRYGLEVVRTENLWFETLYLLKK